MSFYTYENHPSRSDFCNELSEIKLCYETIIEGFVCVLCDGCCAAGSPYQRIEFVRDGDLVDNANYSDANA